MSEHFLRQLRELNAKIEAKCLAADDEDEGRKKLKTAIGIGALAGAGALAHKGIMARFGTARSGSVAPVGEAYKNAGRYVAEKLGVAGRAAKVAAGRGLAGGQGAGEIFKRSISGALKAAKGKVVPVLSGGK
ncbi:MAG: hypothetical protein LBH01_02100 [Verrucomicrobiales bacterium]|jgi:hypothetical protein|nr:hypothetical protein [Verrucomicrobiales bacterium]